MLKKLIHFIIVALFLTSIGQNQVAVSCTGSIHEAVSLQVGYIDDRFGPLGLAIVVVIALSAIFIISITDFILQIRYSKHPAG